MVDSSDGHYEIVSRADYEKKHFGGSDKNKTLSELSPEEYDKQSSAIEKYLNELKEELESYKVLSAKNPAELDDNQKQSLDILRKLETELKSIGGGNKDKIK